MTRTSLLSLEEVSIRLRKWIYEHRYTGLALLLMFTVSLMFSEAFAENELQTNVTKASDLITGPVAKGVCSGAVILGGAGAMYAGQMMVGLAILGTLMLVCVGISIISGGFKVW